MFVKATQWNSSNNQLTYILVAFQSYIDVSEVYKNANKIP